MSEIKLRTDQHGFHVESIIPEHRKTFWNEFDAGAYADWLHERTGWPIRPEGNDNG